MKKIIAFHIHFFLLPPPERLAVASCLSIIHVAKGLGTSKAKKTNQSLPLSHLSSVLLVG